MLNEHRKQDSHFLITSVRATWTKAINVNQMAFLHIPLTKRSWNLCGRAIEGRMSRRDNSFSGPVDTARMHAGRPIKICSSQGEWESGCFVQLWLS